MSDLNNVFAVRLRSEGPFHYFLSRSKSYHTHSEPKLWVRRFDAEKALEVARLHARRWPSHQNALDETAAVLEFRLEEVK